MAQLKKPCFVLYQERGTDGASVELEVRKNRGVDVERAGTIADVLSRLAVGSTTALICNINKLDQTFAAFVQKAHMLDSGTVVIIMAAVADPTAFSLVGKISRVIPFEGPVRAETIQLLCQKIIEGHEVRQRRHKRFLTNQIALMEQLEGEGRNDVQVFNISQGGAYLECGPEAHLKVKDVVKLTIKLDELGKTREVHGKVMWLASFSSAKNRLGIGLEFVDIDTAYMSLLEND